MPTQNSGGDPISERAIRYRRTSDANTFEFEVVDVGSAEFRQWTRDANLHGHVGRTRGQRQRRYGFY